MKFLISLLFLSSMSFAQDQLPQSSKQIIFDAISDFVFFEDEGAVRAPSKISDFTFTITDENTIHVVGRSYSDWDMKDLDYACTVNVLTRGIIKKDSDIEVDCIVTGENWPYFN